MPKHDPEQLERDWREALAAWLDEEIAQASEFYCLDSWYYTNRAMRSADGSVGYISDTNRKGKRASQIIAETAAIRAREKRP